MRFVVDSRYYKHVRALQQVFDVAIISDKGLVFMYRDDWQRICGFMSEYDECVINNRSHSHNPLMNDFNLWPECFLVVYDKSEDYSAHAICNFELFQVLCRNACIPCVLLPTYDLINYVQGYDANKNHEALGYYDKSRGDQIIEVEDN